MKLPPYSKVVRIFPAGVMVALAGLCLGSVARAANISLVSNGDFASTTAWSDGLAIHAGNDYFTGAYNLRTHSSVATSSITFGGDSLTIGPGGGVLALNTTATTTVADLRLNNGGVQNFVGFTPTLSGAITLTGYGQINPSQGRTIKVNSVIGGTGELRAKAGTVVLLNANNYAGGTLVQTDNTYGSILDVQHDGALGAGNVTLQLGGASLKLSLGTTNDYINDSASLILASGIANASVSLSFVGTDTIGALSFDGGSTFAANGTWGAAGSGATHTSSIFTGTGLLQVGPANIPEPSAMALLMGLSAVGMTIMSRRRSR